MVAGFFGGLGPRYYVARSQFPAGLAYPYKAWPGGFGYNPGYAFGYSPYRFPAAAPPVPYYPYGYSYIRPWTPGSPWYGWSSWTGYPPGYGYPPVYGYPSAYGYPAVYGYPAGPAGYPAVYGYPAPYGYPAGPVGYQGYWTPPLAPASTWAWPRGITSVGVVRPVLPLGYNPYQTALPLRGPAVPTWPYAAAQGPLAPQGPFTAPGPFAPQGPFASQSPFTSQMQVPVATAAAPVGGQNLPAWMAARPAVAALPAAMNRSGLEVVWQRARDESGQWDRSALN